VCWTGPKRVRALIEKEEAATWVKDPAAVPGQYTRRGHFLNVAIIADYSILIQGQFNPRNEFHNTWLK